MLQTFPIDVFHHAGQVHEGSGDFVCYKIKTGKWFEGLFSFIFERGIRFSMLKVPCVTRNGRNLNFVSEIHHPKLPLFAWALNPSGAFSENPTDTLLYLFSSVDSDYRY